MHPRFDRRSNTDEKEAAMSLLAIGAAVAGTALLGAAAGFTAAAYTLFNRTIPRQDQLRVDIGEMADMDKWEEYKKFIVPNREWLEKQPLEHVTITSRDGLRLCAEYFPADTPSDRLAIINHGYTGCGMRDSTSISVFFHRLGYDCLIVDHRAHGNSEGKYIGFGIIDRYDCKSWINYVDTRFNRSKKIVLFGVSMGGSIVLMTSGFTDLSASVKAVVADCAFTTPYDVFAHILKRDYHLPPFPVMNISEALCRKMAGYPLTAAQRMHFYTIKFSPQVLCVGTGVYVKQELDLGKLKEAVYKAYQMYETMRLRFIEDEDGTMYHA